MGTSRDGSKYHYYGRSFETPEGVKRDLANCRTGVRPLFNLVDGLEADAENVLHPKTVLISRIKTRPDLLNPRVLHEKYIVQKLSLRQISKEFASSKAAVLQALKRFQIPTRARGNFSDHPSSPPYGKRYQDNKLIEDKHETRVLKTIIIPRYQNGDTLTSIVQFLDSKKIPTKKRASKWHTEMLRQILTREGIYKSKRKPRGSGKISNVLHKTKPKSVTGRRKT